MKENSKAVTGFHAVQADPATHCVEKNGQEESHDPNTVFGGNSTHAVCNPSNRRVGRSMSSKLA